MDIASSMSNLKENFTPTLLNCSNAVRSLVHPKYPVRSLGPATYTGLCSQLLLLSQLAHAPRNWWRYGILLSLIAILFMLTPTARSANDAGALLGTKMFQERIDGADVEPLKVIHVFVLYHPYDDALADSNCGNLLQAALDGIFLWHGSHPAWMSVPSPKKENVNKKKLQEEVEDKTLNTMV